MKITPRLALDEKDPTPVSWAVAVGCVALSVALALARVPLPDVAIPLYLADRLLQGERLYAAYLEINPPLFVWLSLPAAVVAKATGISAWAANTILLGGLMLWALWLCAQVARYAPWAPPRLSLPLLAFTFALFPAQEFGNREHLALVMVTPFLLLAAARIERRAVRARLALVCGLVGGVGFAYKPYFLPAWVLVELFLARRLGPRWLWRPEALALMALGALYAIALLATTQGYLAVVRDWAPLYAQYMRNTVIGFAFPDWWSLLPMSAAAAALALTTRRKPGPAVATLLVASLGFWCGAVLQMKGFSYHHLPGAALAFLVLALVGAAPGLGPVRRPSDLVLWFSRGAALAVVSWSLLTLLEEAIRRRPPSHLAPSHRELTNTVRELAAGRPIVVLSSNPASGWPLTLEAGAIWGSRFMHQWPLAALYHDQLWWQGVDVVRPRPFPSRDGIERTFHEVMIGDLQRYQPEVIVVLRVDSTVRSFGGATRIDYLDYFSSDPRFVELFARYEFVADFGAYRLFRRRAAPD